MEDFENLLLQVLIQLVVIITAAQVGGWLAKSVGQPRVVGEIVAGLMLGPSALGRLAPTAVASVFPEEAAVIFRVLSELGLVLLMFLIGLEFDFSHLRQVGRTAAGVAVAGISLPFALGMALAWWMHPRVAGDVDRLGFTLIVAVALSITAIPILGRIMLEFNLQRTRMGTLAITAAAFDDVLGWILLAAVSAGIHGDFQWWAVVRMLGWTLVFVAACRLIARRLINRWVDRLRGRSGEELSLPALAVVLVVVLLSAAATNAIGIFSIFGPFVLGAVLSDRHVLRDAVLGRLRDFVHVFFLPIFFTYTGLRTDVGRLTTLDDWFVCGIVLAVAIFGKMAGTGLLARAGGFSWRESGCVAVLMNTRALMGLIAINVGRELGVITNVAFTMLVVMALVTTLMTTPLLRRLLAEKPPGGI